MGASDWDRTEDQRRRPAWVVVIALSIVVAAVFLAGRFPVGPGSGQIPIEVDAVPPPAPVEERTATESLDLEALPVSAVSVDDDVRYVRDLTLDVWWPQPQRVPAGPVVVFLHGASRDKVAYNLIVRRLAEFGVVVYNTSWHRREPSTPAQHRRAARAVACAVRLARRTAPAYGGDPRTLTLVGHDLGATTGAAVALGVGDGCRADPGQVDPHAFVGIAGPYHFEDGETQELLGAGQNLGGNADLIVRLIHGQEDPLATPDDARYFELLLAMDGYDAELRILPEAGHETLLVRRESQEAVIRTILEAARHERPSADASRAGR